MKKVALILAVLAFGFGVLGCDVEEKVSEATTTSQSFDIELDAADVNTSALVCAPLPSLETLLGQFDEWNDIKDHAEKVELESLDYKVPENGTPVDGQITFYGGDDEGSVSTDPWGQTDIIEANTVYPDYMPVGLTSLGESELASYLDARDISMVLCSKFSPDSDQIDLKLQLKLVVKVTFKAF